MCVRGSSMAAENSVPSFRIMSGGWPSGPRRIPDAGTFPRRSHSVCASHTSSRYASPAAPLGIRNGLPYGPLSALDMNSLSTPAPGPVSQVSGRRLPATVNLTLGSAAGAAPGPSAAVGSPCPSSVA